MKRVLLTGMSGTGKSSVIRALSARGFRAVDTDEGWCEPLPDGRQRWREDAIGQLLDAEDADVLFVILLSAPAGVLTERPASRTANSFGKAPGELHRRAVAEHGKLPDLVLRPASAFAAQAVE